MKKRAEAIFSGTVQGVGFRFTAERIARRFSVTGFVRNLPNGKVQVVAEGEESDIKEFLGAIQNSSMASYIRNIDTKWSDGRNEFSGFEIAF